MPTRPGSPLSQPWAPSSAVMPYRSSSARTGCEVLVSSAAVSCVDSVGRCSPGSPCGTDPSHGDAASVQAEHAAGHDSGVLTEAIAVEISSVSRTM